MRKLFCFLLLSVAILGCDKKQADLSLEGSWSYFDFRDSSYNEMYFMKEFLVLNLSSLGVTRVYEYHVVNDSILVDDNEFLLYVTETDANTIVCTDREGDVRTLQRFEMKDPLYRNLMIPHSTELKLQKDRLIREMIVRHHVDTANWDPGLDSVLVIPDVAE